MMKSQNWKQQIRKFMEFPEMHYLWQKSLSYLEYIGYRKMMKSLPQPIETNQAFQHISDEIRHSFLFQKLADKSLESLDYAPKFGNVLIGMAEDYFQALDAKIDDWVEKNFTSKNTEYCYILTSYVIEKRAMEVYPFYQAQLLEDPARHVVTQIIKDEKDHLASLEDKMFSIPKLKKIMDSEVWSYEEEIFQNYMDRLGSYQSEQKSSEQKVS